MINIKGLHFSYKKDKVLENFNYSFKDNGLYSIIGESGCGKTTLLNLIGGILKPISGSITYSDDISDLRDSTAFIFQDNNLFDNLTVYENIKLLTSFKTDNIPNEKIDETLETLGVFKYKEKIVSNISGGERQRVSIAIALLMDKKVIIADEPLASLDYTNSKKILSFFKKISKDKLIIISSHNVDILDEYCDKIIDLEHNKYEIDNAEALSVSKKSNKKMNLNKFIYTYQKVMKKKIFIKIISILFLSFCIALLSVLITISQVNYDKVMLDELKQNSNSPVIVSPKSYDENNNVEKYLKEKNLSYLKGVALSNYLGFENRTSKYNGYVTIDDSLENYEVKMTDYLFEEYRSNGILPQNLVEEEAEDYIYQTDVLDFEGNPFNIKIKEIISAKKSDLENGIVNSDWGPIGYRIHMNTYTYEAISFFTTHKYYDDDKNNPNFIILENRVNQTETMNHKTLFYYYSEKINKDEIALSHETLENIEKFYNKEYSINDKIEIVVNEEKKSFILKEINDNLSDNFILFSTYNLSDFNEMFYEYIYYEIENYESEKIITMMNELKDSLSRWSYSNVDSTELMVLFNGSHKAWGYYTNLKSTFKMASVILAFVGILLFLFLTYYSLSTYSINKNKFSLLKIYGMRRNTEYYLLEYDLVILLLISLIFGTPIYALNNVVLNIVFMDAANTTKNFNFFNFGNELLSFIIILVVSSILFFICYFISSRKKLRTHIGI